MDGEASEGQPDAQRNASRVCNNCFGLKMSKITQLAPKDTAGLIQNFTTAKKIPDETTGEESSLKSVAPSREEDSQNRVTRKKEKRAEIESLQFQLMEEPKYSKAYRRMRGMIPPFIATLTLAGLLETGVPRAVAERLWSKRCLWLVVMHPRDIRKIHVADLRSKYTPVGLDLTERYAVWHNLPDWGDEQHDTAVFDDTDDHHVHTRGKIDWKANFKTQMDEMARRLARSELEDDQVRHRAYRGLEPLYLFSHRAPIRRLYSNGTDSAEKQPKPQPFSSRCSPELSLSPSPSLSPSSSICSSQLSMTPQDQDRTLSPVPHEGPEAGT